MDAKNQQDRAKMVEEAVSRMCRLGMMPQVITKLESRERSLNLRQQVFCTI